MVAVDLNADLGEGEAGDAQLLTIVSSCNVACGGHTGDETSMRRTVVAAIENDVVIGAHPSYPDPEGFGRHNHYLAGEELRLAIIEQINSLQAIVERCDGTIEHIKPHGALYNDAATDSDLADIVVRASKEAAIGAALVGLPDSELQTAAKKAGIVFIAEAFVDRAYQDDGLLLPRSAAGAVHEDVDVIVAQALSLAMNKNVVTINNETIAIVADTLCIHGDTPGAVAAARAIRDALQQQGVEIRAIRW